MLNRRHLRIKILQALYAFHQSEGSEIGKAEKALMISIEKMYEMYLFLMLLMIDIRDVAERRIEDNKNKRLPTEEDLNPNRKFVDNRFLQQLDANIGLKAAANRAKVSWVGEGETIRKLYRSLIETPEYKEYMAAETPSDEKAAFEADREVVVRTFKRHLINNESLWFFFDEKSILWSDDLDLVASMVLKTFKSFDAKSDPTHPILPLWKDPEDEKPFVKTLFRKTLTQGEEHEKLIQESTENWEVERIALMDMILMQMAMTEGREFNQIPLKVSLNEYIEIAKYYSTPKSSTFINGILDKIFARMQEEGTIRKVGRGLIS